MPRKYAKRRARRGKKKGSTLKTIAQIAAAAGTALTIAKTVATMVNAEKNFYDATTNLLLTTVPQITALELIPQGDDVQTRTGRSIKLAGIMLRSHYYPNAASTASNLIRIIMFRDNFQSGIAPVASDILASPITVDSFRNLATANPGRYTILMDRIIKLSPYGSTNTSAVVNKYFPIKSHVRYLGTTGATNQNGQGQIYFMSYVDNVNGGSPAGVINVRTRYYDN